MVTINKPIRIFDDTGKRDSYDIDNIIYSDDYIITAKIDSPDFDNPVYVIINKHSGNVMSEDLRFYIAENYTPEGKFSIVREYTNNLTINVIKE